MSMNLRADASFVEGEGWHRAADRYSKFLHENENRKVLFLELGVGGNTPGIIKYPFWQMTYRWEHATLVSVNANEDTVPNEIMDKTICVKGDIGDTIGFIKAMINNDL